MTRSTLILAGSLAAAAAVAGFSLPASASDAHVDFRIVLGTPHVVVHPYAVCPPPRVIYRPYGVYHPYYLRHEHHHHHHHYDHHRGRHGHGWWHKGYHVRVQAGRWHRD